MTDLQFTRPDLAQELERLVQPGTEKLLARLRELDHALRNLEQANQLLLDLLAQLRDNPGAVGDRVDRILGRVAT